MESQEISLWAPIRKIKAFKWMIDSDHILKGSLFDTFSSFEYHLIFYFKRKEII